MSGSVERGKKASTVSASFQSVLSAIILQSASDSSFLRGKALSFLIISFRSSSFSMIFILSGHKSGIQRRENALLRQFRHSVIGVCTKLIVIIIIKLFTIYIVLSSASCGTDSVQETKCR